MTPSEIDAGAPSDTRQMAERERVDRVEANVPWRAVGLLIIIVALLVGLALTR